MFVHIIFFLNSVWVAEWQPFGKELLTRSTICSLCILTIFPVLVFEGGFLVLIAQVSAHCILVRYKAMKICLYGDGHMTKMADIPIYGKKHFLKSSFPEPVGRFRRNLV